MGTTPVKGVDRPLDVYEVVGDRSEAVPARGVTGVTALLLGRDYELAQLRVLLASFRKSRKGKLVVIQGEAGMGKSRLVTEWLSAAVDDGRVTVWQGRGLPYTQGVGYDVLRSLFHDVRQRMEECDACVSAALRPFLHRALGEPLSPKEEVALQSLEPERVKQLTELALRELILAEAAKKPLLLILDDFHWADDLSRDAVQSLVGLLDEAPLLICIITRPTPDVPLQFDLPVVEEEGEQFHLTLNLRPLSPEHSRALLSHLVDLSGLPEHIVDTILSHAEGNPFYIEEFVRMLIEKNVLSLGDGRWQVSSALAMEELEIPTTLRGLMMARVDRLPERLQNALRSAAVIGLQFSARLLDEVERRLHGTLSVEPLLERLVDIGLLVEQVVGDEHIYAFRHILTQETVYGSLLRSHRPAMHRIVAEAVEDLYGDNLEGKAEVLALHYDRAGVRAKAMKYALMAGDRARNRFANRDAVEYYSRALQLSQHLSGNASLRWRAAVGLGEVEQHVGEYEEAAAIYMAALEEWRDASPRDRAWVMLRIGQVWAKRGDLSEAETWLQKGLAVLEQAGETVPELQAQLYSELGWLGLRRGSIAEAREWLEKGLVLVGDTEHYNVLASIFNRLGAVYYHRGELGEAARCVEQALELRERLGDIVGVARSSINLGILKKNNGEWQEALSYYQHSLELMEIIGDREGSAIGYTNVGNVYIEMGEWDKAEENYQRSFAIARQIGHAYELAQAHMNLGRLYLLQQRWDDSARHLAAAVPLYKEAGAGANLNLNDAYDYQGRLCLEQGLLDEALEWAQHSHDLLLQVSETQESVEWGRYEQLVGRIARARGDLEEARAHLERSAAILQANGARLEEARTAYWQGMLLLDLGQADEARQRLGEARQVLAQLGAAADLRLVDEALAKQSRATPRD